MPLEFVKKMMGKVCSFTTWILLVIACISLSGNDLEPKNGWRMPFELIGNKIILPIKINDSPALKIILDTGKPSSGVTLFDKKLGAKLNLSGTQRLRVRGAGRGEDTYATVAAGCRLSLGDIKFPGQRVVILESNPLRGMDADGVIGYTLFGSYVVHIDYDNRNIILTDPSEFEVGAGWDAIPLTFNDKNIPFLEAGISIKTEEMTDVYLYIDLGSSGLSSCW